VEILAVQSGSLAAEAGLTPGMRIVAVNGRRVRDFLDLHLWLGEEVLDLTLEHKDVFGEPFGRRIVRRYGRELGLSFPDPRIRICGNDCPFCFVDQLPPGLRRNLYVRDDDYRFSYLYGNFITLTNLKEHEFDRIAEQGLSPLYVSVHALDPDVRKRILVSKRAGEIRSRLAQLVEAGITLHTQVVLVPGVNDGEVLEETIFGLAEYHPGVASVGVVPVGLTAHRGSLSEVPTFGREDARRVVETVRRYGRSMQRRLGTTFCYVADEFFLLAGKRIPSRAYYEDFAQRENGVGLVRETLDFLGRAQPRGRELREEGVRRVHLVTGESFAPVLEAELPGLGSRVPELPLSLHVAENRVFGRPVTVAGLLGASDLRRTLEGKVRAGDLVLVPDEAVSADGVFLDDTTPDALGNELGVRMVAGWDPLFVLPEDDASDSLAATDLLVEAG